MILIAVYEKKIHDDNAARSVEFMRKTNEISAGFVVLFQLKKNNVVETACGRTKLSQNATNWIKSGTE